MPTKVVQLLLATSLLLVLRQASNNLHFLPVIYKIVLQVERHGGCERVQLLVPHAQVLLEGVTRQHGLLMDSPDVVSRASGFAVLVVDAHDSCTYLNFSLVFLFCFGLGPVVATGGF